MEVGLALFCRWCSKKLLSTRSRYRHEDYFHPRERKLIAEKSNKEEGSSFVKCSVCSVYTLRDVQNIEAHNRSQHHLCKLLNPHADMEENKNASSYTVPAVSAALSPRYFEEISAYPRFQATRKATSVSPPITEATEQKSILASAAAAATLAGAATLLAAVETSEELEEDTEAAETAGAAYFLNFEDGLDANQNYIFEEEGTF